MRRALQQRSDRTLPYVKTIKEHMWMDESGSSARVTSAPLAVKIHLKRCTTLNVVFTGKRANCFLARHKLSQVS